MVTPSRRFFHRPRLIHHTFYIFFVLWTLILKLIPLHGKSNTLPKCVSKIVLVTLILDKKVNILWWFGYRSNNYIKNHPFINRRQSRYLYHSKIFSILSPLYITREQEWRPQFSLYFALLSLQTQHQSKKVSQHFQKIAIN